MTTIRDQVDLISNAITVNWRPEDITPRSIESELRVPINDLPRLFHEITHWQCFQSAVGNSFKSLWDVLVDGTKNSDVSESIVGRNQVPDDYLRILLNFKLGWTLYEPLVEGIALFAQWDATPGESEACSKASMYLHGLFLLSRTAGKGFSASEFLTKSGDAWNNLKGWFVSGRLSNASRSEKVDLLSLPGSNDNGHYIAGYLFVKALYMEAISRSDVFKDTDFFLAFVCAHFFQDPVAARLLLEVGGAPADIIVSFTSRLVDRVSLFLSDRLAYVAETYERFLANGDAPNAGAIEVNPAEWDAMSTSEFELRMLFPIDAPPVITTQQYVFAKFLGLTHRRLLRLRRVTGTATVKGGKVVLRDGAGMTLVECDKESDNIRGTYEDVVYTIYFDPQTLSIYRSIITMVGKEPILASEFHGYHKLELEYRATIRQAILYGLRHEWNQNQPGGMSDVVRVLDSAVDPQVVLLVKRQACRHMLRIALGRSPDFENVCGEIEASGVFGLMRVGNKLFRSAAVVSLLSSAGLDPEGMKRAMAEEWHAWDEVRSALDEATQRLRVELYRSVPLRGGRRVVCAF